jgi:hypothetical protein
MGSKQFNDPSPEVHNFGVESIEIHPDYEPAGPFLNDVAIVTLNKRVCFFTFVFVQMGWSIM